ncbi:MAG TPA: LysE family translocator [Anaerolineales bacterium]|nr:LysE family translocator [Anaerolineales bacterium]
MFAWSTLTAFVVASIAIILAPGLAQALVLATTLNEGRRSGFMTAVGLNVGTLIHAVAAALGLSAVLMTSALAFSIVKFVGAVYLIYLGLRAVWESRTTDYVADRGTPATTSFVKAVLTGVLNPKVALFFLAFLPQFVDPSRGQVVWQFLGLGALLAVMDVFYETVLIATAGAARAALLQSARFERWRQRLMGGVLIALGLRLALLERN